MTILSHHHCLFRLIYHLVLVTKYRERCLSPIILQDLKEIAHTHFKKAQLELLRFHGDSDHIQITFSSHPNIELSRFIGNFKTVSSRLIRKDHYDYLNTFSSAPNLWTRAYGLFSSGEINPQEIHTYIENQGLDRRYTFPTNRKQIEARP